MVPSIELQKAIYQELTKGIYPIVEVVPKDLEEMPLITMQNLNRETNFTKTNNERFTFSIMIHGWSFSRSSLEIKEVEEFIYQTIMNLTMVDYEIELVNLGMNQNLKEEQKADRVVFHSIQEFEITISRKGEDINGN